MNIFERIHVQGFRRLHDVDLPLKPLNVLIGANGSGKTTILDVFTLLSASASGDLKATVSDYGGIDSNLSALNSVAGDKARFARFEVDKSVPNYAPLKYAISLKPSGTSYEIPDESLTQHSDPSKPDPMKYIESIHGRVHYFDPGEGRLVSPEWEHDSHESALSQVSRMYQEPNNFRKGLASSTHYHVLDVGMRAPVRLPQPMREAHLPGKDGEDLVSCLFWMREADPDRFETIEDTLRVGFPGFDRLNFPPVAAGTMAMTWKEQNFKHPFFMHQLSEGTLRFLWLVTLLYSPGLTEVTLLDEPEVSLHPELLSVLADCMREASTRTQLIVATHADRLVRFLRPDEVVAIDVEDDGVSTATRADALDLDDWLDEYTLDQIWQHGRMGGRP
ncbi:MAG: AAA family ATPase [Planctomycetes bacterium]|nr:AAA family ATPase [Planctomycetota bacterium]